MIGGNSKIMNKLLKWVEIFFEYDPIFKSFRMKPAIIPIIVVNPASYRYLCLDFFK